jgi:predicted AlkP superfamily pyrophosphatase or phosphodiesterase
MTRILILAYDGLEYDLVEKWNLRNLMQKTHGKFDAPISPKFGKPHTPSAWASFITGKKIEEHGIDGWWTYGKFLDWLGYKPPLRWIKNKRRVLWKLGIKPRTFSRRDWKCETIFDMVKSSIALNIPAYNEPTKYHEWLNDSLRKSLRDYEETIWKIHEIRKTQLMENLDKEWKLLMAWFDLADLLGHIHLVKRLGRLRLAYRELDRLSRDVKRLLPRDTVCLIVSDHGMWDSGDGVTGDHSNHAFWSLNIETDWKPEDVTDFYPKILEWGKKRK